MMADNVSKVPIGSTVTEVGDGIRVSRVSAAEDSGESSTGSKTDSGPKRRGTGLYEPPSYEDQQRKAIRVEKVSRIIAGLEITPRVFAGSGEVEPKLWQESATSLQSPMIINLKKSLHQRKQKMKIFTANPNFQDYFYMPKGPEYRPMPSIIEFTMGSKEEVVGREVIHKTALKQLRKLQGVWSELGKPYVSLGKPSVHVSRAAPMPEAPYGVDGSEKLAGLDYFPVPPITAAQRLHMDAAAVEAQKPASKKKRELMLKYARAASEMDRMLQKMGLMFFHDIDHAKFPKAPLIACETLTNIVRQGGNYFEEVQIGMMSSLARRRSMAPLEGEQFILGAGGKAIPLFTDGPPPSPPKSASAGSEARTIRSSSSKKDHSPPGSAKSKKSTKRVRKFPPRDDSLVFGWKKKILELRLKLERELEDQIADRADRREMWRSSSTFSAEVARKVSDLLDKSAGCDSPDTTTVWKEALFNYNARQTPHTSPWEFKVFSINQFYDRVCTFTKHQLMADPLLDVLIYFLKEWLENGGKMKRSLLEHLCASLARLPEDIMGMGRMALVMPVLQFISKELHVTSTQFRSILKDTKLDRCHLG